MKNTPGVTTRVASSLEWPDIIFNAKNSVTGDEKVRQALEMAVDRPAVISSQMKGLPVSGIQPLDNHILFPMQTGYKDDSGAYGTYNPKQAEQILTQQGWVPGAGGVRDQGRQDDAADHRHPVRRRHRLQHRPARPADVPGRRTSRPPSRRSTRTTSSTTTSSPGTSSSRSSSGTTRPTPSPPASRCTSRRRARTSSRTRERSTTPQVDQLFNQALDNTNVDPVARARRPGRRADLAGGPRPAAVRRTRHRGREGEPGQLGRLGHGAARLHRRRLHLRRTS